MYKIGELSKLCSLPVKTLRYYDTEGLLIPDRIDPFTGYRYYCPEGAWIFPGGNRAAAAERKRCKHCPTD